MLHLLFKWLIEMFVTLVLQKIVHDYAKNKSLV